MKGQEYRNEISDWNKHAVGDERRAEAMRDIFATAGELPRTVTYEDIDNAFNRWVRDDLEIYSPDGNVFPTMTMFSNQRFSEYTQTWKHVDENKNLLLNFKSITRENNPKKGTIHGNMWNAPRIYYLIDKRKVLDDNGTESYRRTEMREPTPVDLKYKISVFTTAYKKINEFNNLMNNLFNACQVYLFPNGHPMAMKLDNISDESSYQIDDRQFYAQTYDISVFGYSISEDDYRVTEVPLRQCYDFSNMTTKRNTAAVDIEDLEGGGKKLTMMFPQGVNVVSFTIDDDFETTGIDLDNVRNGYKLFVNDILMEGNYLPKIFKNNDIRIKIRKIHEDKVATVIFNGE